MMNMEIEKLILQEQEIERIVSDLKSKFLYQKDMQHDIKIECHNAGDIIYGIFIKIIGGSILDETDFKKFREVQKEYKVKLKEIRYIEDAYTISFTS